MVSLILLILTINLFAEININSCFINSVVDEFTQRITINKKKYSYLEEITVNEKRNRIFITESQSILRVFPNSEMAESYIEGEIALKKYGIPHADILESGDIHVVQKKINIKFSLHQFLLNPKNYDANVQKSLITFFKKTAPLSDLGDFHSKQLIYNGRQWVLLDWDNSHEIWDSATDEQWTIISGLHHDYPQSIELLMGIESEIIKERLTLK